MSEAETPGSARRRRQRRPHSAPPASAAEQAPKRNHAEGDAGRERGLRELVGGGKSQLGVDGALRGRDVNRPTDDDLAEAEATLEIVRRNWTPPSSRNP